MLKALTLLISFHAFAHRSPEQPPEKGNSRDVKFVELTARRFNEDNRVASKQERCDGEYQPKMFEDFIRFFHWLCLVALLLQNLLLA